MTSPIYLILAIILGFFLVFPLFWMGITFLIAQMSGWSGLAGRYQTNQIFPDNTKHFQYGRMGLANYNGTLKVGLSREGLYLGVFILFRVGHPDLFIPWSEITEIIPQDIWILGKVYHLKTASGHKITLSSKSLEYLTDYVRF
jgi:hypothetical protein